MARVRLGGVPQALEALRDQRGLPWLDDLRTDVRIGMRGLARRPGFAAAAALTLSIGIGATAAVATWTNGLLFQPLPVPDPEELVVVAQLDEHTAEFPHELSCPEHLDYRELGDVFEGLAAHTLATRIDLARAILGRVVRLGPASMTVIASTAWSPSGGAARGTGAGSPGRRLTNGLVVVQVAVSMLLLVCAGLFVQSSRNADATDFGFRTDDLLVLSVDPLAQGYDRDQARALYREIAAEVGALPGVRSASWARRAPVRPGGIWGRVFTRDGGTAPEPDAARVAKNYVDPAFFDTVGIPVLQGRGFREEEGASDRRVAVVSQRAARELWPGQEAVGRRIVTNGAPFEVIGVVRDAHMSRSPFEQPPFVLFPFGPRLAGSATLHVHVDGAPSALIPMITETVRRHEPTLAILEAGGMDTVVRSLGMLALARGGAAVVGTFGMLGLLLAAVGLYGVVSHAVVQRKQEFGIRAALGATSAAIVRLALGRGIVLTTLGLALGAVAAVAAWRLTAGFLLDVRPGDPAAALGVAGLLLAGVALLACLMPARRAATADPLATLREG